MNIFGSILIVDEIVIEVKRKEEVKVVDLQQTASTRRGGEIPTRKESEKVDENGSKHNKSKKGRRIFKSVCDTTENRRVVLGKQNL